MLRGLGSAFSLYSAIPVPHLKWDNSNLRLILCFFPVVGLVAAALELLWLWICIRFSIGPVLFGVLAALIPVLVSGGLHLDGLMDTMDARASHGPPEQKQAILKDPHIGAFGVIGCVGYLLLSFGLWSRIYETPWLAAIPAAGFVLSRVLTSLTILLFPTAKKGGLVYTVSQASDRRIVIPVCVLAGIAACVICLCASLLWGCLLIAAAALLWIRHSSFCMREFGGNSGDLAGFYLLIMELLCLIIAAAGGVTG